MFGMRSSRISSHSSTPPSPVANGFASENEALGNEANDKTRDGDGDGDSNGGKMPYENSTDFPFEYQRYEHFADRIERYLLLNFDWDAPDRVKKKRYSITY